MSSSRCERTRSSVAASCEPARKSTPPGPFVLDGVCRAEERLCAVQQIKAAVLRPSEPPPPASFDRKAWIADALRAYDAAVERMAVSDSADPALGFSVRPVKPAPPFEGPAREWSPGAPRALGGGVFGFEMRSANDASVTWTGRVRVVRRAGAGLDVRIAAFASDGQVMPWIDAKLFRSG